MEDQAKGLKDARTKVKTRVTVQCNQLQSVALRRDYGKVREVHAALESLYFEFLCIHEEYNELLADNVDLESYKTVGGADMETYAHGVQELYNRATATLMECEKEEATTLAEREKQTTDATMVAAVGVLTADASLSLQRADIWLDKLKDVNGEDAERSWAILDEVEVYLYSLQSLKEKLVKFSDFDFKDTVCDVDKCILSIERVYFSVKHSIGRRSRRISINDSHSQPDISRHQTYQNDRTDLPRSTNTVHDSVTHNLTQSHGDAAPSHSSTRVQSRSVAFHDSSMRSIGMSVVSAYSPSVDTGMQTQVIDSSNVGSSNKRKSLFKKCDPPTFDGNRREWPEFRTVWRKHAESEYDTDEERAWALKQSMKGRPSKAIAAVYSTQPNAYERIWQRLDSIYGDASMSVQSVNSDLKRLKQVKESDLQGLVDFINEVESCYSQLGEVRQLQSVTMGQIDDLVELLPIQVQRDWMRVYQGLGDHERIHPFSALMIFLEGERNMALRLTERAASKQEPTKPQIGRAHV
jgi:hypothetical protein